MVRAQLFGWTEVCFVLGCALRFSTDFKASHVYTQSKATCLCLVIVGCFLFRFVCQGFFFFFFLVGSEREVKVS